MSSVVINSGSECEVIDKDEEKTMRNRDDIIRDRINRIEKRVVELKFTERDVNRERQVIRFPLLEKAERCARVEDLISSFFVKTMGLNRSDITVTAFPSGYSGRNDEEFLSEIKVDLTYRPDKPGDYSELSLSVYLREGFEDDNIRKQETGLMDRLFEAGGEIEKLRSEKRELRVAIE